MHYAPAAASGGGANLKKIISLFQRNYEGDHLIRDEVVPGAEWVIAGEGVATRKFDGTACMVQGGVLYIRYDAKDGKEIPSGFIPSQEPDPATGHYPGWLKYTEQPTYKWQVAAFRNSSPSSDGTYEACGKHIQGDPEGVGEERLILHGSYALPPDTPRTFTEIKAWFVGKDIEGIVWHHPDGRMVKIKKKDFGLKRSA